MECIKELRPPPSGGFCQHWEGQEEEEKGEEDHRKRTEAVVLGGDSIRATPYPLELGETGDAASITSDILILRKYPLFA